MLEYKSFSFFSVYIGAILSFPFSLYSSFVITSGFTTYLFMVVFKFISLFPTFFWALLCTHPTPNFTWIFSLSMSSSSVIDINKMNMWSFFSWLILPSDYPKSLNVLSATTCSILITRFDLEVLPDHPSVPFFPLMHVPSFLGYV